MTALKASSFTGHGYLLPLEGIVGWKASHDERWSFVQMSLGKDPVLMFGSVAQFDAAFAAAAFVETVCWLPFGYLVARRSSIEQDRMNASCGR